MLRKLFFFSLIFILTLLFSVSSIAQNKLPLKIQQDPRLWVVKLAINNDSPYSFVLNPSFAQPNCATWTLNGNPLSNRIFLHKQSSLTFLGNFSRCNIFYGMFQISFAMRPHGFGLGHATQTMSFLCSLGEGFCSSTPGKIKFTSPNQKRSVCIRDTGGLSPFTWQIYKCE